jgi:hypothetical protein
VQSLPSGSSCPTNNDHAGLHRAVLNQLVVRDPSCASSLFAEELLHRTFRLAWLVQFPKEIAELPPEPCSRHPARQEELCEAQNSVDIQADRRHILLDGNFPPFATKAKAALLTRMPTWMPSHRRFSKISCGNSGSSNSPAPWWHRYR